MKLLPRNPPAQRSLARQPRLGFFSVLRAAPALCGLLSLILCAAFALAESPATVIHIINIKWKADATPEQIKAVVDAVQQLPARYPGIKRVWVKPLRYQGQEGFKQAVVMEFESQDALKKYENSAAQKWWYEQYLPIRDDSRTDDITN